MIGVKLATAALLGLAVTAALAQAPSIEVTRRVESDKAGDVRSGPEPGAPRSVRSGNVTASDIRSTVAPALTTPPMHADPREFLHAARDALAVGRTGEAQVALEQAETRLLTREVSPDRTAGPGDDPIASRIREALEALGHGDRARAMHAVNTALAA